MSIWRQNVMKNNTNLIFITVLIFLLMINCFGEFLNGVETFDGTVKDTSAWEEFYFGGSIRQDDAIIFELQSGTMDYTTKNVTCDIGEIVRVELITMPENAEAGLWLTTNSDGTTSYTQQDSNFVGIELKYSAFYEDFSCYVHAGGDGQFWGAPLVEHSYIPTELEPLVFQIERLTESLTVFSVFDPKMELIDETTCLTGHVPGDLYISLSTWAPSKGVTIFDNVTVIPEPMTITLLGFGLILMKIKRSGN